MSRLATFYDFNYRQRSRLFTSCLCLCPSLVDGVHKDPSTITRPKEHNSRLATSFADPPYKSSPFNAKLDPTLLRSPFMYPNVLQYFWSLITREQVPAPGETIASGMGNTCNAQSSRFERSERIVDAPHARRSNVEDVITGTTQPIMIPSSLHCRRKRQPSYDPITGGVLPSVAPPLADRHWNAWTATPPIHNASVLKKAHSKCSTSSRKSVRDYDYYDEIARYCVDSNGTLESYIKRYEDNEVSLKEIDAILCCMLARFDAMLVDHVPDDPRLYRLRHALVKLSNNTVISPSALFQYGVISDIDGPKASGSYGEIFSAVLEGNKRIALKRLFRRRTGKVQTALCREVLMWRMLRHPSILPFFGLVPGTDDMICSWMENGDLAGYLKRNFGQINLRLKQTWILQIASGLTYVHANKMVHSDLHGGNIVLDENLHALISDFGITTLVNAGLITMGMSTFATGATRFTAPERLELTADSSSTAADVYSFACLCLQIVTGQPPWAKCTSDLQVVCAIRNRDLCWPGVADLELDGLRPLMQQCWSRTPDARPQMREVLSQLEALFGISYQ